MTKTNLLLFILSATILCSCAKTVYVPVERKTEITVERRDTVLLTKIEKEVVEVHTPDTVAYARTNYAEATAHVSKNRLSLSLRNTNDNVRVSTNVIYKTIRDSIPYPVEVIKEKKVRYVTWYDKVIRWVGGASALLLILMIIYKILKWRIGSLL